MLIVTFKWVDFEFPLLSFLYNLDIDKAFYKNIGYRIGF